MAGIPVGFSPPPPRGWAWNAQLGRWTTKPVVAAGGAALAPSLPPPSVTPPPSTSPPPRTLAPPVVTAPAPVRLPTFEPVQPRTDPRMAQLVAALTKQLAGAGSAVQGLQRSLTAAPSVDLTPRAVERPRLVSDTQRQALEAKILELLSGQGPDVGDLSRDPEARAYRLARTREGELERQAEAEALAASGLTGSGDFDSRRFQLGERRAEDIAGFEAGLVGRRRREMTETALQAAGLSLQDLARQAALEESRGLGLERAEDRRLMAALEGARLRQSGAASAGQLALGALGTQIQGTQGLLGLLQSEAARQDQFGLANQQLASEIAFRSAQLQQAQQDLALRRDQFRSDAEYRAAQLDLQMQMFDLQRLREQLERQLLLQQVRRGRAGGGSGVVTGGGF